VKGLFDTGPSLMLSVVTSPAEQADWLQRMRPDYLLTYPSALKDLLLHCRDRGIVIPSLREVRTLSELLPPETRALCREVWGLKIVDMYSTQENGYLAFQCPEQEHYHIQAETVLVEVLDDAGRACRPGEVGRVAVTSLHNFAMPMIRYLVGDLAEVGAPCPCGRGLPVLSRILGRVRNALSYPDGRRGWLLLGDIYHAGVDGIRQYQIVQHSLEDVEIRLATEHSLGPEDEEKLRAWLHHRAGYPFTVTFSYAAEIPRGPGGKFETFRSEVVV
jgi:phenylacetate-CoA ligase